MANPWRDVYPSEFWNQLVDQYRSGALESSSATVGRWMRSMFKTGRVLPQQIDRITQTLSTYHAIPKDDSQTFTQRISLLRSIHDDSVEYCNKYNINKTIKTTRTAEDTFTSMDAYVWSIGRRAMRKAGYLEEIQKFCRTELSDPENMLRYLTDTRHVVDQFQHLQVGCRMEQLDPYHRAFEMHIGEDGTIPGGEFHSFPMNTAFGQWIDAMKGNGNFRDVNTSTLSAPVKPFFVWLEAHPLTTGAEPGKTWAPGQTWGLTDIGAKDTKSVKYRGTVTDVGEWWHWLCPSSAGVVSKVDFKSLKTTPFNTKDGKGKKGEPSDSYAYVWEREGTLLAGNHEVNRVHHSSFMAGGSVRCAGMIAVNDAGKVTYVSNNSGHYRPTTAQLTEFVEWLNQRGVMAVDAKVGFNGGSVKVPVADFLRGSSPPAESNRSRSVPTASQKQPAGLAAGAVRSVPKSM
jgi:hypothetical protein